MYPYEVFFGANLYEIFLTVGLLAALLLADRFCVKRGFSVKLQKLAIVATVAAIVLGFGGAILFQAFYNFMSTGEFLIDQQTGMTFYGGFLFGVGVFLAVWFLGGKWFRIQNETVEKFSDMADVAAVVVPMAHGFGRIGCFFAGCCHGKQTQAWYGVTMWTENGWEKVVPLQLFEALFLFGLAATLFLLFWKEKEEKKLPLLPVYAIGYGVWRFCLEFARGDDRGATVIPFFSPSQLIAVLLTVAGVAYFFIWQKKKKARLSETEENNTQTE
ncbi:MAG: prolipoprotein diacylglyceryl transferase [Clostridia bacterium]|nr:prolipoprotein diacylglyceryl transferase [Clostridia bacterium]